MGTRLSLRIAVAVAVLLTILGAAALVATRDREEARQADRANVRQVTAALSEAIDGDVLQAETVAGLFDASRSVSAREFRVFTRRILGSSTSLEALSYAPRVLRRDRERYERDHGYPIVDPSRRGATPRRAGDRPEYAPLAYVNARGQRLRPGVDLAADEVRGVAIALAGVTGRPAATAPVSLPADGRAATVVYIPIHRGGAVAGYVGAALAMDDVSRRVAASLPDGLRYAVRDEGSGDVLLGDHRGGGVADAITVAGRRWAVTVAPAGGGAGALVWALAGSGVLLAALIVALALTSSRRERHAERVVALRLAERHAAEERLRRSEADRRLLAEHATDVIIRFTREGVATYASPASREALGLEPEELVGRTLVDLAHPDDADQLRERWRVALSTGEVRAEARLRHARGHHVWVEARGRGATGPDGRIEEFRVACRDIGERVLVQRALEDSETRHRAISAQAPVGIFETDAGGACRWVNDRWCEFAGVSVRDARGAGWQRAVHPDDRDRVAARWADCAGGGAEFAAEFRFVRGDGVVTWVAASAAAMRREGGEHGGWIGTVTDITSRVSAEGRLAASREELASVLRAATEFSVIGTDTEGLIDVFNEGAERMLGWTAGEVVGRATPALFHDPREVAARARELGIPPGFGVFVHAAVRGEAETREWTYVRGDGAELRVSLTVTARYDDAGGLVGYIGIARDITRSARAEAERAALVRVSRAVAAQEAGDPADLWALIAREVGELHEATAATITRFDDGGVGTVVGAWSAGGWPEPGGTLSLEGRSAAAGVARAGTVVRTGAHDAPDDRQVAGVARDRRLADGVGAPVFVDGRLWGAIGVAGGVDRPPAAGADEGLGGFADLAGLAIASAEHRAALHRAWDELSTIIEELPAAVWVRDPAGRLVLANRAFDELAGVEGGAALADAALDGEAIAGGGSTGAEATVTDSDGAERTLLVARSPLVDRTGRAYATCGVATDITERRAMDRAKDEFVSVVSHELRTPLSSIRGALALLADGEEDLPPAARDRMLAIAHANSERLVALINDILDLQRIASGVTTLSRRPCDAGGLVREAAEAMASFAAERGIAIEAAAGEAHMLADPDRVMQILNNLISNAVKFSPEGSAVSVGAAVVDDEVRVFVRDEGRGIPADQLEAIFERFTQVDSSDSRRVGGTGLGLAICRELAHQHGGRVWAESRLGAGSCFWLALPRAAGGPPDAGDPGAGETGHDGGGPAVVVAEDDDGLAGVLLERLRRDGCAALHARSGREAVAMATSVRPGLIVLDVGLPDGDGYDVVEQLRARDVMPGALVVYSAHDLDDDARARLTLGRTEFHTKGRVTPDAFHERLGDLLGEVGAGLAEP